MKTTEIKDPVNFLLGLFTTAVLLVSWPRGKKGCKGTDFTKVTALDMADPEYLARLAQGNIGVVQGEASGGIGSIDIDDDAGAEEFLTLNPDLRETLRTRGARGCNILKGSVRQSTIKTSLLGEFRLELRLWRDR
jgi:hypothetical protein